MPHNRFVIRECCSRHVQGRRTWKIAGWAPGNEAQRFWSGLATRAKPLVVHPEPIERSLRVTPPALNQRSGSANTTSFYRCLAGATALQRDLRGSIAGEFVHELPDVFRRDAWERAADEELHALAGWL